MLLATSLAAAVLSQAAAAAADAADAPAPCSPAEYSLLPLDKAKGAPEGEHAACLDGSVPKMHYRPGKGADVRKVLVFLQGGVVRDERAVLQSLGRGGRPERRPRQLQELPAVHPYGGWIRRWHGPARGEQQHLCVGRLG